MDFAKLSGLAPQTIDKIETELHQVQKRTLIKLNQAVWDYEASLKKEEQSTEIILNKPPAIGCHFVK